jgi:hypothetical protein
LFHHLPDCPIGHIVYVNLLHRLPHGLQAAKHPAWYFLIHIDSLKL